MKTSLKKLLHKHNNIDRKIQPLAQLDELAKASEAMQDMRDCYDSLLSAAAAATNSAYEFSESLREMGVCLLQKIALNDDEESGKAMLMLGKSQFELQKLVDSYRNHIFQTITVPSESLINELHTVEEMKYQCDKKRELFEGMRTKYREKGRSKSGKGETFSLQQIQAAKEEFDEEATLFVFRLKSLKQGQSRSLLTQAARHHSAQLSFFKKALKSLEAIEPQVKSVTQQQHIDYQFISVEDDDSEDVDDDDDYSDDDVSSTSSMEGVDDLRFDPLHDVREPNCIKAARNTLENVKDNHVDSFRRERKMLSQSAPLFSQRKFESAERRQLQPSSSRKYISYALPKPGDTRKIPAESENFVSHGKLNPVNTENLYHSSPLEPNKYDKFVGTQNLSGPIIVNSKSVLKESNKNKMPPPLTERISVQQLKPETTSSSKKPKLQSYSGPLTSKPMANKPSLHSGNPVIATDVPQFSSGPILRTSVHHSSSKISPTNSPTFTSPKINELHELPRPPVHLIHGSGKGNVGFSAPLVSRTGENFAVSKVLKIASPLPIPPQVGYFSMPLSSSATATKSQSSRPLVASPGSEKSEDVFSPPITPMMLAIQNSS